MARGKRLTPAEIEELRRLKREGYITEDIEDKTGYSHTTINKYTSGVQPVSPLSIPVTLPAKNTKTPIISQNWCPQNKTNRTPPNFYDPSQTSYYFGPNLDTWAIQEQQRKQKEQQGYPITFTENRENMTPSSDSYVPSQEGYYFRPNQGQYQAPRISMNPPETDNKQDQYLQKIQEEERKREQQHQRDEAEKKRQHEEQMAQTKRETEQRQLDNDRKNRERDERLAQTNREMVQSILDAGRDSREYYDRLAQMRQETEQIIKQNITKNTSAISPKPLIEPENSTTMLKEMPVKEKPIQTSENNPNLIGKPSTEPHDSQPDDFEDECTDDIHPDHSENVLSLPEVAIVCGCIHLGCKLINIITEAKKNTKIPMVIPILETVPLDNNKTQNKKNTKKEKT